MYMYRKGIRFRTPLARMPIALSLLLGFVLSKLDLLLKSSSICIMFHFFGNGNRYLTVKLFLTPLRCTWSRTPCMSSRTPLSASRTPLTFFYASSVQENFCLSLYAESDPCTSSRTPCTSSRTPSVFTGFNCLRTRSRLSKDEI